MPNPLAPLGRKCCADPPANSVVSPTPSLAVVGGVEHYLYSCIMIRQYFGFHCDISIACIDLLCKKI